MSKYIRTCTHTLVLSLLHTLSSILRHRVFWDCHGLRTIENNYTDYFISNLSFIQDFTLLLCNITRAWAVIPSDLRYSPTYICLWSPACHDQLNVLVNSINSFSRKFVTFLFCVRWQQYSIFMGARASTGMNLFLLLSALNLHIFLTIPQSSCVEEVSSNWHPESGFRIPWAAWLHQQV